MVNLSKSRYVTGLRCPKILWLDVHKPEEKSSAEDRIRLEAGIKAGETARSYFGDYTLVPYSENKTIMIDETYRLLEIGYPSVICEASIAHNGNFCSVDILLVTHDGLEIVEVKSAGHVEPYHLDDMAYQYYVLAAASLPVTKVSLLHVNNAYERNGPLELDKLFTLVDCTAEVLAKQKNIEANIEKIRKTASAEDEPDCPIDRYCFDDPPCPYKAWCLRNLPPNNIFNLTNKALPLKDKLRLYRVGIVTYEEFLASKEKISADAWLQMQSSLKSLPPRVDPDALKKYFADIGLRWPVYHLDFETFQEAVPSLDRQHPWEQIPFQYSLHIQRGPEDTESEHREFLAVHGTDPRRALAERLCADVPPNAFVMAYFMGFEKGRIKDLAALYPDLSEHLTSIHDNIRDLIIPFKQRAWYSHAQHGSNSIKAVLPAMFPANPSLDHKTLDLIHNGNDATAAYLSLPTLTPEQQAHTRAALLAYCRLDTYAMVKILSELIKTCCLENI